MRFLILSSAFLALSLSPAAAESKGGGAKQSAPGTQQTQPGGAKTTAPGRVQTSPGGAKQSAPGGGPQKKKK